MEENAVGEMLHPDRFYEFLRRGTGFVLRLWDEGRIEYQVPVTRDDIEVAEGAALLWLHNDCAVTSEHATQRSHERANEFSGVRR